MITEANLQLTLTDACARHLEKHSHEKGTFVALRVRVTSGGCAGLQYIFSIEPFDDRWEKKLTVVKGNACVVTDALSLPYINGSIVDYQETLMMSQFSISNPNSEEGCSCGNSFQLKN
jgi:iron-sulfur cluster assembly accessory protein